MFLTNDDTQKADDLNCFFLRFDTQFLQTFLVVVLSSKNTSDQGDNRLLIDLNYVQSLFKQPRWYLLLFIKSLCRGTVPGLVLHISKVY